MAAATATLHIGTGKHEEIDAAIALFKQHNSCGEVTCHCECIGPDVNRMYITCPLVYIHRIVELALFCLPDTCK